MGQYWMKVTLQRADSNNEITFRIQSRRWMRLSTTELRIGAWGLEAVGDLGGYKPGTLRLLWERVAELHYGPSGRGAVDGLYVREGEWCSRCVLPFVSEAQATDVIAAAAAYCPRLDVRESALEVSVGEVLAQAAFVHSGWLPSLGRRGRSAVASLRPI